MIIIKFLALVIAIMFTVINFGKMLYEVDIPFANFLLQAISIATFIFLQFNLF